MTPKQPRKTPAPPAPVPKLKFYDEQQTRDIRIALEREILLWPGVYSKPMMGCLCYFQGKKFFAFLITKAIVITKLGETVRGELSKKMDGGAFEMSGMSVRAWPRVPLKDAADVKTVMPFVRESYESTLAKTG